MQQQFQNISSTGTNTLVGTKKAYQLKGKTGQYAKRRPSLDQFRKAYKKNNTPQTNSLVTMDVLNRMMNKTVRKCRSFSIINESIRQINGPALSDRMNRYSPLFVIGDWKSIGSGVKQGQRIGNVLRMTGFQIRTIIRPKYNDDSFAMYQRYRVLLLATRVTDDERRHDTPNDEDFLPYDYHDNYSRNEIDGQKKLGNANLKILKEFYLEFRPQTKGVQNAITDTPWQDMAWTKDNFYDWNQTFEFQSKIVLEDGSGDYPSKVAQGWEFSLMTYLDNAAYQVYADNVPPVDGGLYAYETTFNVMWEEEN